MIWFGLMCAAAVLYVGAIYLAPQLVTVPFTSLNATETNNKIQNSKPGQYGDRLYLPEINVDVAVSVGGDANALSSGAWQRNPNLGDPAKGGNVVLSAPRFTFTSTPMESRLHSPFFNLGKMLINDEITLDYKGVRYIYKVDKKYDVSAGDTNIEKTSSDARLTLYATDNQGNAVAGPVVSAALFSPIKK